MGSIANAIMFVSWNWKWALNTFTGVIFYLGISLFNQELDLCTLSTNEQNPYCMIGLPFFPKCVFLFLIEHISLFFFFDEPCRVIQIKHCSNQWQGQKFKDVKVIFWNESTLIYIIYKLIVEMKVSTKMSWLSYFAEIATGQKHEPKSFNLYLLIFPFNLVRQYQPYIYMLLHISSPYIIFGHRCIFQVF